MHTDFPLVKLIIHRAQGGGQEFSRQMSLHTYHPPPPPPEKKKNTDVSVVNKVGFLCKCHTQKKKNIQDACYYFYRKPKTLIIGLTIPQRFILHYRNYNSRTDGWTHRRKQLALCYTCRVTMCTHTCVSHYNSQY